MKNFIRKIFNPQLSKPDLERFELYNVFSNDAEAYIAKGVLETNGIKCFIEGDTLSSVYPSQLSFSGVRLLLRKCDFLIADNLLSENLVNKNA